MKIQAKADLMLVLVTLCWGLSYYFMDICLEEMGALCLNAYRFLGAFAIAGIIGFRKIRNVNLITLKYSFFVAVSLVFVYIGATFGVKYTSLSNSGFLCALTVVFTPVASFIIKRQKPGKKLTVVVMLCLAGIALMTLNSQFRMALGDILCLMCAVAYTFDLLITERAVSDEAVDAFQLGVYQLGFTGVFMLILSFIFEKPCMPSTAPVWGAVIFLAVFCTGAAFIVQAIAQQYTTASHVGVIFALEPVFAGIVAFVFAGEILTARAYVGAALMIIGLFLMEIDIKNIFNLFKSKYMS